MKALKIPTKAKSCLWGWGVKERGLNEGEADKWHRLDWRGVVENGDPQGTRETSFQDGIFVLRPNVI